MAEPLQHLDQPLAMLGSILSAVFAFLFDQPLHVVFAAFSGSLFAISILDSMPTLRAVMFIIAGTFFGAICTNSVIKYFTFLDARVAACCTAFACLYYRENVLAVGKRFIDKLGA